MRKKVFIFLLITCLMLPFFLFTQGRGVRARVKNLDSSYEVGKQYLVSIAVNRYKHWRPLYRPVKNAEEIREVLETRYYIDEVVKLYDEKASKAGIMKLFKELQGKLKVEDSVIIFYAGHGYLDTSSNNGFWVPVDGGLDENVQERWIPNSIIRGFISQMKSKHILLISDSCFSGDLLDAWREKPPKITHEYFKKAYKRRSRQVLTSGASERVPDKSEFAIQLKLALQENGKPYLDPLSIYDEIRDGIKGTLPMFGYLKGTNHQEGGAFLFFLKDKKTDSQEKLSTYGASKSDTASREIFTLRVNRVAKNGGAVKSAFKFPRIISYKSFKNGSFVGECQFRYRERTDKKGISSLKLTNFQGLGITSNESLISYIFSDNLSLYASFLQRGIKVVLEMRWKEVMGFDGKKGKELIFKDIYTDDVIQKEHFIDRNLRSIDILSALLAASQRVASGKYESKESYNLIFDKRIRVVDMVHLGREKIQFQGKEASSQVLAIVYHNIELFRLNIFKDNDGYCFPVKISFIDFKNW